MAEHVKILAGVPIVTCDSCGRREEGPTGEVYLAYPFANYLCDEQGWQVWSSRSRRNYCPDCNPGRGHKMRLVRGAVRHG